jgi:hypothetical protein
MDGISEHFGDVDMDEATDNGYQGGSARNYGDWSAHDLLARSVELQEQQVAQLARSAAAQERIAIQETRKSNYLGGILLLLHSAAAAHLDPIVTDRIPFGFDDYEEPGDGPGGAGAGAGAAAAAGREGPQASVSIGARINEDGTMTPIACPHNPLGPEACALCAAAFEAMAPMMQDAAADLRARAASATQAYQEYVASVGPGQPLMTLQEWNRQNAAASPAPRRAGGRPPITPTEAGWLSDLYAQGPKQAQEAHDRRMAAKQDEHAETQEPLPPQA